MAQKPGKKKPDRGVRRRRRPAARAKDASPPRHGKRQHRRPPASETALRESETRFQELADNISQFAWTADAAGWIYWYNRRWYDYTGTTLEEMQGWGWQKIHHPDHVDRVVRRIRQSFESGTSWEDTFPLRGRDGTYRWFLSRALPIRNEAGEVIRWFGTNTDITEQIEAEKALRELNETLEQRVAAATREQLHIWNVSQDLLVVADLEGKYLSVNPAWTSVLGWPASELVGRASQWLLHPDDQERTLAMIARFAAGHRTSRLESRFRDMAGAYRWISWRAVLDGNRIYGVGRDVTDLKNAEERLRNTRRELAQAGRRATMAAMSGAISHEIKQPLGAIVTNASAGLRWLSRTPPDLDEARQAFQRIAADARRADQVIQAIRDMFKASGPQETVLDANELVHEAVTLMQGELDAAEIAVQLHLAALPLVSGHRGQLQQVVMNLIANAVDAMRPVSDRPRTLDVKSGPWESDAITLSIADSGIGIEAKNSERIFDAFFTTKANGMGMGLAICRSIIDAHGGQLTVSPGAPHGAVFRLVLPVKTM